MTESLIEQYLNGIVDEFKTKLTIENGYRVQPVNVYSYLIELVNISKAPALSFVVVNDSFTEIMSGSGLKMIEISCIGVAQSKEEMFRFAEDVQSFLYKSSSDFTYNNQIVVLTNRGPNYGYSTVNDAVSRFTFDFSFGIMIDYIF